MNTKPMYIQSLVSKSMNSPAKRICRVCQKEVFHDDLYLTFATKNRNKKYVHRECYVSRNAQLHDVTYGWIHKLEKIWIGEAIFERRRLAEISA